MMTDSLSTAFAEAARSCEVPHARDVAYVANVRLLYATNMQMFLRLGFDVETAKFLSIMLAARTVNDERGAEAIGRA